MRQSCVESELIQRNCVDFGSMKRCQGRNLGYEKQKNASVARTSCGVRWIRLASRNVSSSASRHRAGFARTAATRKCRFINACASDTAKACVNVATVLLGDRHTLGISAPASETMIDHPPATWRRAMLRSAAGAQISRLLIVADNFLAKRTLSFFTRSTMISNPPPMLHQASCRRIVQPGGLQPGGSPCCNRRLV